RRSIDQRVLVGSADAARHRPARADATGVGGRCHRALRGVDVAPFSDVHQMASAIAARGEKENHENHRAHAEPARPGAQVRSSRCSLLTAERDILWPCAYGSATGPKKITAALVLSSLREAEAFAAQQCVRFRIAPAEIS